MAVIKSLMKDNAVEGALRGGKGKLASLDGVHVDTVKSMERLGMIAWSQDEFGEAVLSLRPNAFTMEPMELLEACSSALTSAVNRQPSDVSSKILVAARLHYYGFVVVGRNAKPLTRVCEKTVQVFMPLAPLSYFEALGMVDKVWNKCPDLEVHHGLVGAYYDALVNMADLSELLAAGGDVRKWKAAEFRNLMAGLPRSHAAGDACVEAIEDAPIEPADLDGGGELGLEYIPHALPDMSEMVCPLDIRKHPISVFRPEIGKQFMVYFAESGRAFVQCPFHRVENCRRYVTVKNFRSSRHAAAWLIAWTFAQPRPTSQTAHVDKDPQMHRFRQFWQICLESMLYLKARG